MTFLWLCIIYCPFYFILVYLLSLGLRPIIQFGPKVRPIFGPFLQAHSPGQKVAQRLAQLPSECLTSRKAIKPMHGTSKCTGLLLVRHSCATDHEGPFFSSPQLHKAPGHHSRLPTASLFACLNQPTTQQAPSCLFTSR